MPTMKTLTVGGKTYTIEDGGAQRTLISGTNIKTINNESLLGSGNITIAASANLSFTAPDGITWSSLSNTWTPSVSGIATTRINPSNSSSAYLLLRDSSNGNVAVAQVATTGGLGASISWPVIGGHTYNVGGHSTNVTSMETRLYPFNIEVTV